jgi:adenylyltransferase/sulfurtransferase
MKSISAAQLKEWMDLNKEFMLVDVREGYEREDYNIGGIHIPLAEVMERKEELSKEKPVVVYCEKGIRSGIVIQRLESFGFQNLINLSGGMKAWKHLHA